MIKVLSTKITRVNITLKNYNSLLGTTSNISLIKVRIVKDYTNRTNINSILRTYRIVRLSNP